MAVMVALLRGVNVGGKTSLAMADLRRAAEACGYDDVRTYIQSGNLLFSTSARSTQAIAHRLQAAIAEASTVTPEVVVRTRRELADVIDDNPYVQRGEDAAHLHVTFLAGSETASLDDIDIAAFAPEEATAIGQHVYLFLPGGMGRSKLAAELARRSGPTGTTRSWRTVTKLLELAEEIG